jgi:hypothetical protein
MYTHYFGFFIVIAQNIFYGTRLLFRKDKPVLDIKRWVLLQGLLVVSYLPWSGALIKQLLAIGKEETANISWIPVPSFGMLTDSLETYAGSFALMCLFLILSVFAISYYRGKNGKGEGCLSHTTSLYFIVLWLTVPVFLPVVISYIFKPIFVTRYTIAASPALYILTARGIQTIRHRLFRYVIILLIIGLSATNIGGYYSRVDKQQWREVAGYIGNNAHKGDVIILIPGHTGPFIFDYYFKREDVVKEYIPKEFGEDYQSIARHVLERSEGKKRLWLVISLRKDPHSLVRDMMIRAGYTVVDRKQYDGKGSLPSWAVIDTILFEKSS